MQDSKVGDGKKSFIDDLVAQAKNKKSNKTEVLQLNLQITAEEMKNIKKLVNFLKANDRSVTLKSLCYEALKESGIFQDKGI